MISIKEQKNILRKEIQSQGDHYDNNDISIKLLHLLRNTDVWKNAKHIMMYSPFKEEIDLLVLLQEPNKKFYFPRIDKKLLKVVHVTSSYDFEKGTYDIGEPKNSCPVFPPEKIDLIIVPGLAFDTKGNRLGRGQGFYDRFLKNLKKYKHIQTIALAYPFQIQENIPFEPHDQKVDRVIGI
jgi:5-formyltetrahydrofolate cyclo-ligase